MANSTSGLAIVCGATGGLGPAVVAGFASRGDRVIAVARSVESLRTFQTSHGQAVSTEAADLTQPEEVEALWMRIDARTEVPRWVVNVTGGFRPGSVLQTTPSEYRFMQDLNLASAWWSSRAAAQRLQRAGGGAIVNVSSRSGLVGGAGAAAYAVSKAAVIRLTQVLADELKESGVRVNVVLPAIIDTEANRATMPPAQMRKAISPQAIAQVILFLCSEAAAPITGAAIPVYGRF